MRGGIVRPEFDGDAAFLHGGIQLSNAVQGSGERQSIAGMVGSEADGTPCLAECRGPVGVFGKMRIAKGFGRRRRTFERRS